MGRWRPGPRCQPLTGPRVPRAGHPPPSTSGATAAARESTTRTSSRTTVTPVGGTPAPFSSAFTPFAIAASALAFARCAGLFGAAARRALAFALIARTGAFAAGCPSMVPWAMSSAAVSGSGVARASATKA